MPTEVLKSPDGKSVLVIHEPGNMTRYLGTAHQIADGPVGYKNHWVVSFPTFGSSTIFEEGQDAHWSYVAEKLGMRRFGSRLADVDVSEMAKVIALMVPGVRAVVITDETGHLTDAESEVSRPAV